MADDEDMGTSFMRKHMSENQTSPDSPMMSASSPKGRGVSGYGSRGTVEGKADEYPDSRNAGGSKRVNRKDKGAKGSGVIGTDEWNQNKYGGDGY